MKKIKKIEEKYNLLKNKSKKRRGENNYFYLFFFVAFL
jgi:hypothetical protein